jgi:hypothetical protein
MHKREENVSETIVFEMFRDEEWPVSRLINQSSEKVQGHAVA